LITANDFAIEERKLRPTNLF